jgi:hypothetical protein
LVFDDLGLDPAAVLVDCSNGQPLTDLVELTATVASLPVVLIGVRGGPLATATPEEAIGDDGAFGGAADLCDVLLPPDDSELDAVRRTVVERPNASVALAVLLRGALRRGLGEGLAAESAVYSTLQAGPEFLAWRDAHPVVARRPEPGPAVEVRREGDRLLLTLARPHVHNAYNVDMRDGLLEGLAVAASDATVRRVVLDGAGASFCSGGDLDEFGSRDDPASAHLVRLARSAGRAIAAIADRVEAHLHGMCLGSGIELPAFAGTVVARPDTRIGLPELALGLIPGAGGTVSLPARIGRRRTAYLALSDARIDAETALAWGLVDQVEG